MQIFHFGRKRTATTNCLFYLAELVYVNNRTSGKEVKYFFLALIEIFCLFVCALFLRIKILSGEYSFIIISARAFFICDVGWLCNEIFTRIFTSFDIMLCANLWIASSINVRGISFSGRGWSVKYGFYGSWMKETLLPPRPEA